MKEIRTPKKKEKHLSVCTKSAYLRPSGAPCPGSKAADFKNGGGRQMDPLEEKAKVLIEDLWIKYASERP